MGFFEDSADEVMPCIFLTTERVEKWRILLRAEYLLDILVVVKISGDRMIWRAALIGKVSTCLAVKCHSRGNWKSTEILVKACGAVLNYFFLAVQRKHAPA